jgi:HEAT repeat protein
MRIPRSGRVERLPRTTKRCVGDLVPRIAAYLLAFSFAAWIALGLGVLIGRSSYERRRRRIGWSTHHERESERLLRRAERRTRTVWGRWRRVAALSRLVRMHHPASLHLAHCALSDPDPELVGAAIRALGALGDRWAIELLVTTLRNGGAPRSRIAAQLERLAPTAGPQVLPLLRDREPEVRFWGATLIGPYPDLGEADLLGLTHDEDANVRAAAVEALGYRSGDAATDAVLALLEDPGWFVRVHAARSAGHLAGVAGAPSIAKLLADERWWVRTAAKDALRGIGSAVLPALVPLLSSSDGFARNGAAEVLQDTGIVDRLALEKPDSVLLREIYAAGGPRFQAAAETRAARAPWPGEERMPVVGEKRALWPGEERAA